MPELPDFVLAMLDSGFYPHHPQKVELVQTQMSFLFLAGEYVYKIKKPVNLGYLDYTSLDKRRFFCEREVELNRRLCPDVYLGVEPLSRRGGHVLLDGDGEVFEYSVKMKRLPGEAMLDVRLGQDNVSADDMLRLAQKLAGFHAQAETGPEIIRFGSLDAVRFNTDENFSQTYSYLGRTVSEGKYSRIKDYTDGFLKENASLFERRAAGGRIRDCHGDLHAAHVCLADDIYIYDCIEFNDRFRYCDVASEIAFLAMDLDHYGRADLSGAFTRAYISSSGDGELGKLLNFYKCYRAYVRGKVEGFKLNDPYISPADKERTLKVAASYFDLAHAYTRPRPFLVIMVGLVGTGKTTLARGLARRLGLVHISSDVTRKKLANVPLAEPHPDRFDSGLYSEDLTRRTYDAMFAQAREALAEGRSVVLDASFIRSGERRTALELAWEVGADFFVAECVLDDESIRRRLAERSTQRPVSDGRWEILAPQKERFESVTEVSTSRYIRLDTSGDAECLVKAVAEKIG